MKALVSVGSIVGVLIYLEQLLLCLILVEQRKAFKKVDHLALRLPPKRVLPIRLSDGKVDGKVIPVLTPDVV